MIQEEDQVPLLEVVVEHNSSSSDEDGSPAFASATEETTTTADSVSTVATTVDIASLESSLSLAPPPIVRAETPPSPLSHDPVCRVCLETEGTFISPCDCRGSQEWVHRECLDRWRSAHGVHSDNFRRCEICMTEFELEVMPMPCTHGICVGYHRSPVIPTMILQVAIMGVIVESGENDVPAVQHALMGTVGFIYALVVAHAFAMVRLYGVPASLYFDGWRWVAFGMLANVLACQVASPFTSVLISGVLMQSAIRHKADLIFGHMETRRFRVVERRCAQRSVETG